MKRTVRSLSTALLLLFAACRASPPPEEAPRSLYDPEVEVLLAFFARQCESGIRAGHPIVIEEETSTSDLVSCASTAASSAPLEESLLARATDQVPEDLIRDFCERNADPHPVPRALEALLPVRWFRQADRAAIFDGKNKFEAWKAGRGKVLV